MSSGFLDVLQSGKVWLDLQTSDYFQFCGRIEETRKRERRMNKGTKTTS
jgi:hypothetical protein